MPHPDFLPLTLEQLLEWGEFYRLEPWGFEADDARHAFLLTTIARAAGAKDVSPEDFSLAVRPPEQPLEGQRAAVHIAALLGAKPAEEHEEPEEASG